MTAYEMRISHWSSHLCSSDLFLAALDDPSRHLQRLLLAALQHDQRLALLVAQVLRVDLEMLDDGAQPEPQFVHVVFVVPDDDASLAHDLESDQVAAARCRRGRQPPSEAALAHAPIGSASCRDRVGQYRLTLVVGVSLKKKTK